MAFRAEAIEPLLARRESDAWKYSFCLLSLSGQIKTGIKYHQQSSEKQSGLNSTATLQTSMEAERSESIFFCSASVTFDDI